MLLFLNPSVHCYFKCTYPAETCTRTTTLRLMPSGLRITHLSFSKIHILNCELDLKSVFRTWAGCCGHPPSFPVRSSISWAPYQRESHHQAGAASGTWDAGSRASLLVRPDNLSSISPVQEPPHPNGTQSGLHPREHVGSTPAMPNMGVQLPQLH